MMKTRILSLVFIASIFSTFISCNKDEEMDGRGKANIYLTDAPIDDANIAGIIISVSSIEVNGPAGWQIIKSFDEPLSVDLLSYQNGEKLLISEEKLAAGTYSALRLNLNIPLEGEGEPSSPTSYVLFADGTSKSLYLPNDNAQEEYKIAGSFTVPMNGVTNLTLDFDVRKALVTNSQSEAYMLKPTIRLVSAEEAGTIQGVLSESIDVHHAVVFAYPKETFSNGEIIKPKANNLRFANAASSTVVNDNNQFTLAFMNKGDYDLYVVGYDESGNFEGIIGAYYGLNVAAMSTTEIAL